MLVSNSVIIHLDLKIFCAEEYLKQLQAPLVSRSNRSYALMLLFTLLTTDPTPVDDTED